MTLILSALVVQGPRDAEEIQPLLEAAPLVECFSEPAEVDLEFIVPGKLDGVHVSKEPEQKDCLDETLDAIEFPKLPTHAKTLVRVHLSVTAPPPEQPSEEPVDGPAAGVPE